jgi:hypothetical protein
MRVDLVNRLLAAAPVAAIVGDEVTWDQRVRGGSIPAIVLYEITPGREYNFDGPDRTHGSRIQFDCMGLRVGDYDPLFEAVLAEMEQTKTVGSTFFGMSFLAAKRSMAFVDVDGIGSVGGISADFFVWWKSI